MPLLAIAAVLLPIWIVSFAVVWAVVHGGTRKDG